MADDVKDELLALAEDVRTLVEAERSRGIRSLPPGSPGDLPVTGAEVPALEGVPETMGDSTGSELDQGRTQLVFGVGREDADLVVIGEAPDFHEDQKGEPFAGPAGDMLDRMLANVLGLGRDEVYLLNIVKCRPPDSRAPGPDEVAACAPFLRQQLEVIQPRVLLVLGSVAFKALFDTSEGITRARGTWKDWNGVPVMPTFHPAYLLRKPGDKRLTFDDLKKVRARYDSLTGRS